MELSVIEIRVLAALVEKDRTTPDSYPLSTNALVAACNQKTSRDPVMSLSASDVDDAMKSLRLNEWARTVKGTGDRSYKHRHLLPEKLSLDDEQTALLAVLMLRGAQSPGELKTRTERYIGFDDLHTIERALGHLAARDVPLVVNVGRKSGQSQDRWMHLMNDPDEIAPPVAAAGWQPGDPQPAAAPEPEAPIARPAAPQSESAIRSMSAPPPSASPALAAAPVASAPNDDVESLRAEVAELRALVERLYDQLGVSIDESE